MQPYKRFTYTKTLYPLYVRSMGYLSQAVGLRGRFRRRRELWKAHLEQTKRFVMEGAESCSTREKVVVLGSGLLLDVPLEALSAMFKKVVLVDLVHLPEVRERIKSYRNVELVYGDVTGISQSVFDAGRKGYGDLPSKVPALPGVDERTGLVVSLNILSQLYAFPHYFVLSNNIGHSEEALCEWSDGIVNAHYIALRALACDVCLVADFEYMRKDETGKIVEQGSTIRGFSLPEPDTDWIWKIAPLGDGSPGSSKELRVGGWHFIGK